MIVLKEKKFFENEVPENVRVEWIQLNSTPARRDALVTGDGDLTILNLPNFIAAKEAKMPLELLSNTAISGAAYYSIDDRGYSLESIGANDKLAVTGSIGNTAHLAFQIACLEMYGDSSIYENNIIALTENDVAAMVSNTRDLTGVIANDRTIEWPQNMKMVLDLTPYIQKYNISGVIVAASIFAEENPAIIDAFYQAERKAVQFINENPDEAALLLTAFWGESVNAEDIKRMLLEHLPELEISESGYDRLASFMYQTGIIDHEPVKFRNLPTYNSLPKRE
jgi:NitT/TauT family transport system substrate-binding protein